MRYLSKKISFFFLFLFLSLIIIGAGCNKNNSLPSDVVSDKSASNPTLTDAAKKQPLEQQLEQLESEILKDGRTIAEHNVSTVEASLVYLRESAKSGVLSCVQYHFSPKGLISAEIKQLSKEQAAALKSSKREKRSAYPMKHCESDDPKTFADCLVQASRGCAASGGKPYLNCYSCDIVCLNGDIPAAE